MSVTERRARVLEGVSERVRPAEQLSAAGTRWGITMSDILTRRQTRFVLWCPATVANPPELIIGQLQNGNPPTFRQLARKTLQAAAGAGGAVEGLFELDAAVLGLTDGETYHYWFKVEDTAPGGAGRVQTTDPWRLPWITVCMRPTTPRCSIRPR